MGSLELPEKIRKEFIILKVKSEKQSKVKKLLVLQ